MKQIRESRHRIPRNSSLTKFRYEPHWQDVFWGSNYKRLLEIKKRIDPQNLFTCNRCVGSDIVLKP